MKIGLAFRNELMGLPGGSWVVEQFDSLIARISGVWQVQHNDNGGHANVTAQTVRVGNARQRIGPNTSLPDLIAMIRGGDLRVSQPSGTRVYFDVVQDGVKQWGWLIPEASTRLSIVEDGVDGDERVKVLAGGQVVIGGTGVESGAQLELVASDGGLVTVSTSTDSNREGYFANFLKMANGTQYKAGVFATTVADDTVATGYMATNIHASYMSASTQTDDMWIVGWGNHGAAFFTNSPLSTHAPGAKRLKVRGALFVGDFDNDTSLGALFASKPTVTGGAGATAISSNKGSEGSLCLVSGQSSTKRFTDLVMFNGSGGTPSVIGTSIELNTPATRTYAVSSEDLTLSLDGTDAYTVRVTGLGGDEN